MLKILNSGETSCIRTDNGPEFTSKELELWSIDNGMKLQFLQPKKPMQNGFIERFNRLFREAILDAYLFLDLNEVRVLTEKWIEEYNNHRAHKSMNNQTPTERKIKLMEKGYSLNESV